MSDGGKQIKRDSHVYACQANHYNWVYPQEKWVVMGNWFLTVDEIHQEEERWCWEIEGEKRACKKHKYEAVLLRNVEPVADTLEDDSLSAVGCQELASTCIHVHKVDYNTAHNPDFVMLASQ